MFMFMLVSLKLRIQYYISWTAEQYGSHSTIDPSFKQTNRYKSSFINNSHLNNSTPSNILLVNVSNCLRPSWYILCDPKCRPFGLVEVKVEVTVKVKVKF